MMSFGFGKRKRVVIVEALIEVDIKEVSGVDMDVSKDEDMEEVREDPPLVLIVLR
jgi:hypothetical protein